VLLEAARAAESDDGELPVETVATQLEVRNRDVFASIDALSDAGYFVRAPLLDPDETGGSFHHIRLSEKGRRAVGLWPSERSADALVDLFRQAADLTDDPEEKGRLRAAAGAVMSVSRDIVADVGAAWVRSQTGL
jgi:hypothetical protein